MEYLKDLPEIIEAILAIIGGIKVIMRYADPKNKIKVDDKIFAVIEVPLAKAFSFLRKK